MTNTAQLKRVVGLWGAVWMGLGSILGTGVFVSLGIATGVVGPAIVMVVLLAAIVAAANGISSAQLAAAHPVSGGTYEYGHKFVNPTVGFIAGWMFLSAKSASAATAALGCAGYFLNLANLPEAMPYRIGVALAIVATLTALVASGVRRSNTVNIAIVASTLITLSLFVAFALSSVDAPVAVERLQFDSWLAAFSDPSALLYGTALMFVAYTGYGRIATLGEEVREPQKTIPIAIIATLAISMLLYSLVAIAAVVAVGAESFAASTSQAAAPLEVVARTFNTPQIAYVVAFGAITAMAGVLLNLLLGLSRVLLAMARRGEMPRMFSHVDGGGSPVRAVIGMGTFVALLTLLGDIKTTWSFSAFTVLIYYSITNLAALKLPADARRFPRVISIFGLLSCLGIAFFVEWKVWAAGCALIVVGLVVRTLLTKSSR